MHLKFCSGFEKLSKTVKRPQTFLSKVSLKFSRNLAVTLFLLTLTHCHSVVVALVVEVES